MKKIYTFKYLLAFCVLLMYGNLSAQDLHFSQYYSFSQALNPALTGNFDGSFRVALIHRNQWNSFLKKSAYMSTGAAIDLPFLEGQLKNDKLAIGLVFTNDRMGQASLVSNNIGLSFAYHKGLGKQGKHRISLGAQAVLGQRRLDRESYIFYDQFDVFSHAGIGTSAEFNNMDRGSFAYFDFNAGVYWKSNFTERFRMQGGFATFHFTQPSQYFITTDSKSYLPRRYQGDMAAAIYFTKKWAIEPDVLVEFQGKNNMFLFGGAFGYYFNTGFRKNTSIHFGARYRMSTRNGDAVSPMLQVEFRNFRIGGAYDVNVSKLKNSSDLKGAFEISLVYVGESIKSYKASKSLPARRF